MEELKVIPTFDHQATEKFTVYLKQQYLAYTLISCGGEVLSNWKVV